jgi:hypothetical protein
MVQLNWVYENGTEPLSSIDHSSINVLLHKLGALEKATPSKAGTHMVGHEDLHRPSLREEPHLQNQNANELESLATNKP